MTAKEQVLKVYPDAEYKEHNHGLKQIIWVPSKLLRLSVCYLQTEDFTWQSALTKINENGTTSNPSAEEAWHTIVILLTSKTHTK